MGGTRHSGEGDAATRGERKSVQLFAKTEILCYTFPLRQIKPAPLAGGWRETGLKETPFEVFVAESEGGKDFFIWIRCNPLKSPDSAKEIQGNPSFFFLGGNRAGAIGNCVNSVADTLSRVLLYGLGVSLSILA
jgi:hypothetical protein